MPQSESQQVGAWREIINSESRSIKNWSKSFLPEHADAEKERLIKTLEEERDRLKSHNSQTQSFSSTLYSSSPNGSRLYLSERNSLSPQQKYSRAQTSSQEYGWLDPSAYIKMQKKIT
mmetsp:Transcript_6389/g.9308  ORF Transcript_6389/g.9308 Transcript_6389/m.9308 type:complete len:118 (+) Transcript_6389:8-361(+)